MKIMICCSKHFYDKIEPIKKELETEGHVISLPNSYDNPGREYEILNRDIKEHAKWKGEMFRLSEEKIKEVDALLILNYEKKGQANYIGGATLLEMYDSFKHGKQIFMINPVPDNILRDEIVGLSPIILNGDLKKIDGSHTIKSKIRTIPHFPKQGIMFRDITTLLKDKEGYNHMIELLVERYKDMSIDVVAGIESRGFITGSVLAHKLGVGFIPIRKPGKLPSETISEEFELEYGKDKIEIHTDAVSSGMKVLLVDDLIATGGTALAACNLIKKLGGEIVECSFIVDLPDIGGKKKLLDAGYKVFNLVEFEGD